MSVVIPVYNREGLVKRCLDSVFHQTYRPIRLIVVDNNSADNSKKVVEEWAEQHAEEDFNVRVFEETIPGAAAARNRGLLEVDTEYMLFFDSDDRMAPDLAMHVMETFKKSKNLDVVYWRTAIVNEREEVRVRRFAQFDLLRRQIYNGILCTQSYAVRTSYFKRIGAWDSSLPVWNDFELGLRILAGNPKMKGLNRLLTYIYPQVESITGTDYHSKAGLWEKSLDKMEKDCDLLSESQKKMALSMLLYRRVNLAALYAREGHEELALPLLKAALSAPGQSTSGQSAPVLSKHRRRLLRLIYEYTRRGGRAAYLLWT